MRFPGLYDILGNVKEWEDSCNEEDPADGALTPCNLRGGGMNVDASTVTCALGERPPRSLARFSTGVRCCATLQ